MAMISTELLRRYPYFAGVEADSLKQVAMIAEEKTFTSGEEIFREDEVADHLFIVTHGEVDIQTRLGDGGQKTVDTCVGGDVMIWSALVGAHRTHFSGVARQETKAVSIEARKLRQLLEKDSKLGFRMMSEVAQAVANRLEGAQLQLAAQG